jgi:small subunit ribosomal protein S27e
MTGKFLKVKCPDCGSEQVLFDRPATLVPCAVCNTTLAKPGAGKAAEMRAQLVEELK